MKGKRKGKEEGREKEEVEEKKKLTGEGQGV
jgi:hypothetical protein